LSNETLHQIRKRHREELCALIADAVRDANGSRVLAAETLGVTRSAIDKQIRYFRIDVPKAKRITTKEPSQ